VSPKKKKKSAIPKVRHTWEIRPTPRVKPSGKIYRRFQGKKKSPSLINELDWFGERE